VNTRPTGAYATVEGRDTTRLVTVCDLTAEDAGWLVKVFRERRDDHGFLISQHETFTLTRKRPVRTWTLADGTSWVGLTDDDSHGCVIGTEHIYAAETPCELVRQVRKSSRRTRSSAAAEEAKP
jgi:hypothetical protein